MPAAKKPRSNQQILQDWLDKHQHDGMQGKPLNAKAQQKLDKFAAAHPDMEALPIADIFAFLSQFILSGQLAAMIQAILALFKKPPPAP